MVKADKEWCRSLSVVSLVAEFSKVPVGFTLKKSSQRSVNRGRIFAQFSNSKGWTEFEAPKVVQDLHGKVGQQWQGDSPW